MPSDSNPVQAALELHKANRLVEAEQLYRQFLAVNPQHPIALYFMGTLLGQTGRLDEAIMVLKQALAVNPNHAECFSNCGKFLLDKGLVDEAMAHFQSAIRLQPNYAQAHFNLANALKQAHRLHEAIVSYRRALQINPHDPMIHFGLAAVLQEAGLLELAAASYLQAIRLKPDYAAAYSNLGNTYQLLNRTDEALTAYQQAIHIDPRYADAHNNLGNIFLLRGQPDEAIGCYRRAIDCQPWHANAHNNLGTALRDTGRIDEALACYRKAAALRPADAGLASNVVFCTNFLHSREAAGLEAAAWWRQHGQPLAGAIPPHSNDRNPERRLRIGYISPDFRMHPVASFMATLLRNHDQKVAEVFCYSNVKCPDEITARLHLPGHTWRDIAWDSDLRVADVIRADRIDILVDLAMHTGHNRLLVFARKPAPVQVTYLAYPGTTGLKTIDYRLSDPFLDPPDSDLSGYSEETVCLPETFWCYAPLPSDVPPVNDLPAAQAGHVTFGSLNLFAKLSDQALATWAELMVAVPQSRLLMYAPSGRARDRALGALQTRGVDVERCQFVARVPYAEYFAQYHRIDIGLDSFPNAGGTTTFDALWMGVPVVTLAGSLAVARGGVSILSNLGIRELIAQTPGEYVEIAAHLASDIERLKTLRATLRERMRHSALMDGTRFARHVEAAYRRMWRKWCAQGSQTP